MRNRVMLAAACVVVVGAWLVQKRESQGLREPAEKTEQARGGDERPVHLEPLGTDSREQAAREEEETNAGPTARTFDEIFEEICSIVRVLRATGAEGDGAYMPRLSGLYLEIFDTAAPWEGYLGQLDALPPSWEEEASQVVRRAADLGIDFWLQRTDKDEGLPAASATASVDALVDRLLFHQDYCDLVGKRLLRGRYVERSHEAKLLTMLGAAKGDYAFAAPVITKLLAQLWTEQADVEKLLVQALGADRNLAMAALKALLLGDAVRDEALRILAGRRDIAMVEEVARAIASDIDVEDGVYVLKSLKSSFPNAALHGAYARLAGRDTTALVADYRAVLEDAGQVSHRKDLTAALGNYSKAGRVEHASFSFDRDPSPHVRGVALMALGAESSEAAFTDYLERALSDPALMGQATSHYIANAIGNRGNRGDRAYLLSALSNLELAAEMTPYTVKVIERARTRLEGRK